MPGRVTKVFVQGAGEVKLDNGETWSARLATEVADDAVAVGAAVTVIAVRGAAVAVSPTNPMTERTAPHD